MSYKHIPRWLLVILWLTVSLQPVATARARAPQPQDVTAYDLIIAMNTLRMSNGLPALIEDPIVNAVAQATAEIMAANNMSWHIGDVRGRLAAAGYGGGATVWATENFAVGNMTIDQIMQVWADPDHMRPAVEPAYCNVGAGVATVNGKTYYWRIQPVYGTTPGEWSPAWRFYSMNPLPAPAPLLSPPSGSQTNNNTPEDPIVFTWTGVPNADKYNVQISRNYKFTDIVEDVVNACRPVQAADDGVALGVPSPRGAATPPPGLPGAARGTGRARPPGAPPGRPPGPGPKAT